MTLIEFLIIYGTLLILSVIVRALLVVLPFLLRLNSYIMWKAKQYNERKDREWEERKRREKGNDL